MYDFKERLAIWISRRLPALVVYWVCIRLLAQATYLYPMREPGTILMTEVIDILTGRGPKKPVADLATRRRPNRARRATSPSQSGSA